MFIQMVYLVISCIYKILLFAQFYEWETANNHFPKKTNVRFCANIMTSQMVLYTNCYFCIIFYKAISPINPDGLYQNII